MYLVALCARCRAARAVEAGRKTAACPRCGRSLVVAHAARGSYATLEEARHAIGAVNAKVAGAPSGYADALVALAPSRPQDAHDDASDRAAARARSARGEAEKAETVARALSEEAAFGADAFARALEKAGIPGAKAEGLLQRLAAAERVFEPAPGRFRIVPS